MTESVLPWHNFPDTAEDGANPISGATIEVEAEDRHTTFPDAPLHRTVVVWDPMPPHGLNSGYRLLRWRCTTVEAEAEWRAIWEAGEARRRAIESERGEDNSGGEAV